MNSGVFFERNGTLIKVQILQERQVNPLTLAEFQVNQEAAAPLRRLKAAGFILIGTTNQPGLSSGLQSRLELEQMHALMRQNLPIDDVLVCPHNEGDGCPCRKPKDGLFREAAYRWRLDLDRSFIISENWQDAVAAQRLGCTSILITSPRAGHGHHDYVVSSLEEAVNKVLQLHDPHQQRCVAIS
jgi:D-glycero-D-manno-heptose 1,7-bisphosphate phosphatase